MLRLLIGTDWKENRQTILRLLCDDIALARGSRVLMVPELVSHDTERRLAEAAGDTASRFSEVLPFSRLGRRVAERAGCATEECLDNGGRVVAMAATTRQLHSRLKAYASVENRPEFLNGLLEAVDEFKRCCITLADLQKASSRTEGAFAQKLEELALIYETYDAITARGKRDPRDQMTWVLEQMEATDFAESHVFYIDGFPDFSRQQFAILEHLILNSPTVTLSLTCDKPGTQALAYERAGKTAADILSFARSNGIETEIQIVRSPESSLNTMCAKLLEGNLEEVVPVSKQVTLQQADDLYDECEFAAARILDLIRGGSRFRDIAVVCGDMAQYDHPLRLAFERCGIPLYRSGTEDVLQKTVITALLTALNVALGGFEKADVLRYMKSVLSPLDTAQCDAVENYAILWNISGKRWIREWTEHPDGLVDEWLERDREALSALNRAREILIEPLLRLADAFHAKSEIHNQVEAIYTFFSDIRLSERLEDLASFMDAAGDNRSAQILNQLWEILIGALEQLQDMLNNTIWEPESFIRLFTLLLSQYDVGTIPTVLDAVMVGPISAMRCHQVKHMIVLGLQEGCIPSYTGAAGILSDREREQLRLLDVPLSGGGMESVQTQFGEIYDVFCAAEESVMACCSDQPSFVFTRLLSMGATLNSYKKQDGSTLVAPEHAASFLSSRGAKKEAELLSLLDAYKAISSRTNFQLGSVSRENVASLYGRKLNLSASQVDKQADCRFSYFLRYGLRAKELKEVSVDPAEFGTYFHAVLERTAKRVMELGGFHTVSLEDTVDLAMKYSAEYISQHFSALDSGRVNYLFRRNVQELSFLIQELWMELSRSSFTPTQFEFGFGEGREMPAVQISGADMEAQLGGFVDRVDVWNNGSQNYFRVVDYKSGKKSFDYCDVFNGMGLQMLLYMYALEQEGEAVIGNRPVPAGVQYFSARYPFLPGDYCISPEDAEKKRSKELKRKGLILADEDVMIAMQPDGAPERLSAGVGKDGQITGDVADRAQFRMLRTYVFDILKKLINEIASGNVTPNPYTRGDSHNACRFCPYGSVCHQSSVTGRRDFQAMKPQRFWEEVEKEVAGRG